MSVVQKARQFTVKNSATVVATENVGDDLVHVTATVSQPDLSWQPGQAVALVVDPDGKSMKDRWRHYTVRAFDPEEGRIEFLMARHDESTPGGRFLASLQPEYSFTFMGPGGNPILRTDAPHYVFLGDRTSLASISAMLDGLTAAGVTAKGDGPGIDVVVATPDPDRAVLPTAEQHDVTWVKATDAAEIRQALLDSLPDELPDGTQAYVTGEMETMRAVRKALTERGVSRRSVGCHAHWTPGRRGM
ncbi:MAG: siderophore-interacting protein [Actinomycetota bacterium]